MPNSCFTLDGDEVEALNYMLGAVAVEADRMADADPRGWAKHSLIIEQLISDFDYEEASTATLDARETAAVRYLMSWTRWEDIVREELVEGMKRLRAKLASTTRAGVVGLPSPFGRRSLKFRPDHASRSLAIGECNIRIDASPLER